VTHSRHLSISRDLGNHLSSLSDQVQVLATQTSPSALTHTAGLLQHYKQLYDQRKNQICSSSTTTINLLALQDGSATNILSHPSHGTVYADNRIETRYDLLTALLISPQPGQVIPPWSRPIDAIAPEELDTPDPTSFPDDILSYLSTTHEEARHIYVLDLDTHVTKEMRDN
jgi:hypothetical protein